MIETSPLKQNTFNDIQLQYKQLYEMWFEGVH